ncbi:procathepsin L-like [Polypterus senegalus]|uniref:procathepsin L-like n=1 Tax=Polypterus senegalus TaxID=55291 RepID=UPI001966A8AE|nr:procathepsin L-like [Polypterus senegalus]
MKFLVLCAVLLCCLHFSGAHDRNLDSVWNYWKTKFKSHYHKTMESKKRSIWEKNFNRIKEHNNKPNITFKLGMNQFADLSNDEYNDQILRELPKRSIRKKRSTGGTADVNNLHTNAMLLNLSSIDYRSRGYVTPVKDQGRCGSCWAFSTTGAIEGQLFKKTGQLVSLSEQNLVDCSKTFGTYGCQGAWMGYAYKYVLSKGGIASSAVYPYNGMDNQTCLYNVKMKAASITNYMFLPSGNLQALADAVATIGPITVTVDASLMSFQFYKSGIYNDPACNTKINHAVLLVGYGSEADQNYWIIKNSWGTQWGENGYMRMARTTTNYCGIASYTLFPVM